MLDELYATILARCGTAPETSYTSRLFLAGEDEILKKVGEEAIEVILAGERQRDQRLVEEISDLFYHLLVLLAIRGLKPQDIYDELARRKR